jgi:hypothetical protein
MRYFQANTQSTALLLAGAWHRAQPGQIVGPRHARPKAGLRVAPVPPQAANLTGGLRPTQLGRQVGAEEQVL